MPRERRARETFEEAVRDDPGRPAHPAGSRRRPRRGPAMPSLREQPSARAVPPRAPDPAVGSADKAQQQQPGYDR